MSECNLLKEKGSKLMVGIEMEKRDVVPSSSCSAPDFNPHHSSSLPFAIIFVISFPPFLLSFISFPHSSYQFFFLVFSFVTLLFHLITLSLIFSFHSWIQSRHLMLTRFHFSSFSHHPCMERIFPSFQ